MYVFEFEIAKDWWVSPGASFNSISELISYLMKNGHHYSGDFNYRIAWQPDGWRHSSDPRIRILE